MDYDPVGEIGHHTSAVVGYELYGGKFFEDTGKNEACHGAVLLEWANTAELRT